MASAEARYHNELLGKKVVFAHGQKVYWVEEVFKNNPRIEKEPKHGQQIVRIENYPGKRPYIKLVTKERFYWNERFVAEPGEVWLDDEEKKLGIPGAVIVEPNVKAKSPFSMNKAWPWERWQTLVKSLDLPWVQLVHSDVPRLKGVKHVEATFREALSHINLASLVVTTDGAFHHAAAALRKPAVVLWGGLVSPLILGYKGHKNIWHGAESCGTVGECDHCKQAMASIEVDEVKEAIEERTRHLATGSRNPSPAVC